MRNTKVLLLFIGLVLFGTTVSPIQAMSHPVEDDISIVINKTSHMLSVYVNEDPVISFPVATGKGNLTPEGEFTISNKIKNPWYNRKNIAGGDKRNPLGTRWLGINVPNTGGYRYGIHGTNRPYSIGQSVSSGCIRMQNRDVEWLFKHIPIGTTVIIKK